MLPKEYGIASQMEQLIKKKKMHLYVLVFCVLLKLNGRESRNNGRVDYVPNPTKLVGKLFLNGEPNFINLYSYVSLVSHYRVSYELTVSRI